MQARQHVKKQKAKTKCCRSDGKKGQLKSSKEPQTEATLALCTATATLSTK